MAILHAVLVALSLVGARAAPQLDPGYYSLAWAPGPTIAFAARGGTYTVDPDTDVVRRSSPVGDGDSTVGWSPDGRALLVGYGLGKMAIVRDGRVVRIGAGFEPVWSPDGGRIAYGWTGGFWIARADGTGAVRVVHSRYLEQAPVVTWSPDGRRIAYVACTAAYLSDPCEHQYGYDVYISSSQGGARRRVTKRSGYPQCPSWSSRDWLGFYATGGIGVVQRDGRVRVFPGGDCPVWSPDGKQFAFTTGTGLRILGPQGAGLRIIHLPFQPSRPVWSPHGRRIAFLVTEASDGAPLPSRVYVVDVNGMHLRRIWLPSPRS